MPLQDAWTFLESKKAKEVGRGQLEVEEVRWEVVKALGGLPELEVVVSGTEDVTSTEKRKGVWESEWARLDDKIRGIEDVKWVHYWTLKRPRDARKLTFFDLDAFQLAGTSTTSPTSTSSTSLFPLLLLIPTSSVRRGTPSTS